MSSALNREQQIREAEELLGREQKRSFAKQLFFGKIDAGLAFPFPKPVPEEHQKLEAYLARVRSFLKEQVDPTAIDRDASIPETVIRGLFDLQVMSMSILPEHGGLGFSQQAYCRVMEEIGAVDASLGVLVNAHQSIGLKSLLLFGSAEQKKQWLPRLARGEMLAAFALTEENAGSDAGGIETRAVLNSEGTHYILNGRKQWITNGGSAGLLTVMAKVPNTKDEKGRERITAFLVTPDMAGFQVEAKALEKCGIRGTMTSKLVFRDVRVPVGNIIGPPGKGLRVALTLLDFGRTTFGATCTGVAKRCVRDAIQHAKSRHQFGKTLGDFELVKDKLAGMAASAFAMESGTYLTASLIDRGIGEYMVETAMLKVFASEHLWEIVNDTVQIFGGRAYFKDLPYERMLRDARINMIGEGANDVLRTFIALVGMRDVVYRLKGIQEAMKSPIKEFGKLADFAWHHLPWQEGDRIPLRSAELADLGHSLEDLTRDFGHHVEKQLIRYREDILDMQYIQARIADAATELYMMMAVLSRMDAMLQKEVERDEIETDLQVGRFYCQLATGRIRSNLRKLGDNFDRETTATANALLSEH